MECFINHLCSSHVTYPSAKKPRECKEDGTAAMLLHFEASHWRDTTLAIFHHLMESQDAPWCLSELLPKPAWVKWIHLVQCLQCISFYSYFDVETPPLSDTQNYLEFSFFFVFVFWGTFWFSHNQQEADGWWGQIVLARWMKRLDPCMI